MDNQPQTPIESSKSTAPLSPSSQIQPNQKILSLKRKIILFIVLFTIIIFLPIPSIQLGDIYCIPCLDLPNVKCPRCPRKGDVIWNPSLAQFIYQGFAYQQKTHTTVEIEISPTRVIPSSLIPTSDPTATISAIPTSDPTANWKTYENKTFNIAFKFPPDWLGPEVYEHQDGFFSEVGTDKVYPYFTLKDKKLYEKKNSYYIRVQFERRPTQFSISQYKAILFQTQTAVQRELSLVSKKDGETYTDIMYSLTRIREVKIGNFKGVEFISSISGSAGETTDWVYSNQVRKVLLINDNYDIFSIVGSPNNIDISGIENWKEVYDKIDKDNLNIFRQFVETVRL